MKLLDAKVGQVVEWDGWCVYWSAAGKLIDNKYKTCMGDTPSRDWFERDDWKSAEPDKDMVRLREELAVMRQAIRSHCVRCNHCDDLRGL